MSWLRRKIQRAKCGQGNWFGDGSDGDIRITTAGAEQSFDGGVTWSTLATWILVGTVVSIPSVQDGDMVVVNARSLTVDSGYSLTLANRCRGLLVYCTGSATINGTLTMTARGCHANPADAVVTDDTPVAPSDGAAVSEAGIVIAKYAKGCADTGISNLSGCGTAAVSAEANQDTIDGNGVVVAIPRVGGQGAASPLSTRPGADGGTIDNGSGGGGSGGPVGYNSAANSYAGDGADGTCFAGGPGGGGTWNTKGGDAAPFGGAGGAGAGLNASGGSGNPGGAGLGSGADGGTGCGGLLILCIRGDITGAGIISVAGVAVIGGTFAGGGGSGAGVLVVLYAGEIQFTGTWDYSGGAGDGYSAYLGGTGGAGALILKKIDE